jgi:hypothetical protein
MNDSKINCLDKIILFVFPRWGLKRVAIRANFKKFSGPGVSPTPQRNQRNSWFMLSRHKKDYRDPGDKIFGLHKSTAKKNLEEALGFSCKEDKKWII